MNIVEQPEQVPTVDQELEEIQEIRGGRVGFFKRFFNRIKGNDGIRKVHLDEMKEIYDKIRILPEGDLKESLQLDYNDMLMHYSVYADTINNSNLSEVPDLEYTEKLQSISYRLKNHEAAMKATVEEQLEEPVMGTK